MPELEQVRAEYEAKGVKFLALSLEPDANEVARGAKKIGVKMPVAIAKDQVLDPLGVKRVPSTVWINREGRVVTAASGERKLSFLRKHTGALVDE